MNVILQKEFSKAVAQYVFASSC